MRASNRLLGLLSVVALVCAVAGCGSDVKGKLACVDDKSCSDFAAKLYSQVDAAQTQLPRCCSGFCVSPALGCETGFRYFTSAPSVGDCVPTDPMCPGFGDMATPPPPDLKPARD